MITLQHIEEKAETIARTCTHWPPMVIYLIKALFPREVRHGSALTYGGSKPWYEYR
jgi:hypothetical protein